MFQAIHRFSEDIDLGLTPASLGWSETDLDDAPSKTARQKRVAQIEADCANAVSQRFGPALERVIHHSLGKPPGKTWLTYELEAASHSPILYFVGPEKGTLRYHRQKLIPGCRDKQGTQEVE